MNRSFQVKQNWKGSDLHLSISGIFDSSAALDLIEIIYSNNKTPVYIDTNKVNSFSGCGKETLNININNSIRKNIHFGGRNAESIAPEGCIFYTPHVCKGNCKNCVCRNNKQSKEQTEIS